MKKILLLIVIAQTILSASAQDILWNSYPDGEHTHTYTNIGNVAVDATIQVSGSTSKLDADSPEGRPLGLKLTTDFDPTECVTLTITFSQPVTNLSFNMIDIDFADGAGGQDNNYQDQVTITGLNGGSGINPTIGASSIAGADEVSGNTIKGLSPANNNTNLISFGSPVTQVVIQYCSGPDLVGQPSTQFVYVGDFTWADAALPVRLLSFKGQQVKERIELGWETASEANSDRFDVERSTNALAFERMGSVMASGFSNNRQWYSFTDNAPLVGYNYYRLRQVDRDGKAEYSKIIAVRNEPGGFYYLVNAVDRNQLFVQTNALAPQFGVFSLNGFSKLLRIESKSDHEYILHIIPSTSIELHLVKLQTGASVYTRKVLTTN